MVIKSLCTSVYLTACHSQDNNYSSETWNGTWVSSSQYVYRDVDESLVMVDAAGGAGRVIVPGNVMRDPRVFRFKLSPDQKYVMLAFRPQRYLN